MSVSDLIKQEIASLPMLSEVARKLLMLTADEDHSLAEVADIIEKDVYLSTNVLKLANSAGFARGHQIETVNRAVMHIGESNVMSLVIGMSTGELLHDPLAGYAQQQGSLWAFCLQEAIAAREVAKRCKIPLQPDLAYTAGMLFNIGMVVMSDHLAKESEQILKAMNDPDHGSFIEAERKITGTDRDEVGTRIAERWRLPKSIQTAIRFGHSPSEAPEELAPLVYSVHIGDILARTIGYGGGVDALSYSLDDQYHRYFDLDNTALELILLDILEEFTKIESYFLTD
ncbi:HDOD domain protein [bacterium BMS3Bbin04]|nr:HDOD domain protein [bacterium BMS3Bbin04]